MEEILHHYSLKGFIHIYLVSLAPISLTLQIRTLRFAYSVVGQKSQTYCYQMVVKFMAMISHGIEFLNKSP